MGLALASLFFYPLASILDSDRYYLQWRGTDAAETFTAIAVLAVIIAGVAYALWPRTSRAAAAGLLAISLFPMASLVAGVIRQLPFEDALRAASENQALRVGLPIAIVALSVAAFMRWPVAFNRTLRMALLAISPISLVVLYGLARSSGQPDTIVAVERPTTSGPASATCAPVFALLFDELSFAYLYENGQIRSAYPEIARFGERATHYLAVRAGANETLEAVPSILAARSFGEVRVEPDGLYHRANASEALQAYSAREPDGLFATARRLGYRTEVAGYYLAYCDMLGDLADACRSMSFYNVGTTSDGFSPFDPIRTTFVLWPRQFPFGVVKNAFFSRFQRDLVEQAVAFAHRPVNGSRPVFRLVHFSIPHLPFVFGREGFDPPFDPLDTTGDTEYARQIDYVDRLLGEFRIYLEQAGLYDRSTVILLSDHGWRFGGGNEPDPLHVPFIARMPGQPQRVDVTDPQRGEVLLKQVLEASCPVGP